MQLVLLRYNKQYDVLIVRLKDGCVIETFVSIIKDNWQSRQQIMSLAIFELMKRSRGSVLSWAWLFIRPAIYLFCFWFAFEIGMRAARDMGEGMPPYFLWLSSGIIPWFFMQEMFGSNGVNVFKRYSYLVNKVKFPVPSIPFFMTVSAMLIQLVLQVALLVIYLVNGMHFDIYLIQIPIILILMFIFWYFVSLMFSTISAISNDFSNFMAAMSTPFFWLSGVIFDVTRIDVPVVNELLLINPITFFVSAFRDALYYKTWFWDDSLKFTCFAVVFVLTIVVSIFVFKRLGKEVPDVL